MKTITIGFSESKKFLPIGCWLIKKWMGTPYSHVYMKFRSESLDRTLIYEAVGNGVRFMGDKVWQQQAKEVCSFDIQLSEENWKLLLQHCVDFAGTNYAYSQNLGIALAKVINLKTNPFQSGQNCSELVSEILKLEGYNILCNTNLITPKDIYDILSKK